MVGDRRKRVLVVMPTAWDAPQLEACRSAWEDRFEIVFAEPSDDECGFDFDGLGFVERVAAGAYGRLDGVLSSSDYPGATLAAAIAARLGLPGPRPQTVIGSSHKYYSRLAQREAVPEATPDFELVDPDKQERSVPRIGFPCFVKPVKGAFSVLARRVDSAEGLDAFLANPAVADFTRNYLGLFNRLVRGLTDFEIDGRYFIAEQVLRGRQVTLEGYTQGGEFGLLGIVDSAFHPGTHSFVRFDYPSSLPAQVQDRMLEIARRAVRGLGLDHSLCNIEFTHEPETGRIRIVEVNPRICGQFADLYHKVDGVSSYEVALALACGERPRSAHRAGAHAVAASVPLRVFARMEVLRGPDASDVRAARALAPDALVWTECLPGQILADFDRLEDGQSHRYAVVNLGAQDAARLRASLAAVVARLGFEFAPV